MTPEELQILVDLAPDPEAIRAQVAIDQAILVSEFGAYTLKDLATGRVGLTSPIDHPHVLYLVEGRLVIDDRPLPEELEELGA